MKTVTVRDRLLWASLAVQRNLLWIVLGVLAAYVVYLTCFFVPVPGIDEEAAKRILRQ